MEVREVQHGSVLTRILFLGCIVPLAGACKKEAPPPGTNPPHAKAASAPAGTQAGTDGNGDGTGSSVANARALRKGGAITFPLSCAGATYVGPFRFSKTPEELSISATARSPTGAQICFGGEWLDASGAYVGGVGIGCVDGKHVADGKITFEYSPHNGGNGANPVYLVTRFTEPKPEGCPSGEVTLKLP